MTNKLNIEFNHEDYEYSRTLYSRRFKTSDPFLLWLFRNHLEYVGRINYLQFYAKEELHNIKNFLEFENYEIIKKRKNNNKKSAFFYCFWRYSIEGLNGEKDAPSMRGWSSSKLNSSHTFKKFIKGKESQDMVNDIITRIDEHFKKI